MVSEINPVLAERGLIKDAEDREHRLTLFETGLENVTTALKALTLAVDGWALLQREQNSNVAKIATKQVAHEATHVVDKARESGMLMVLRTQWWALTLAGSAVVVAANALGVI